MRCTGARSHSPRSAAATPPRLPTAMMRAAKAVPGERPEHDVERDVVAAHDDEIGQAPAADERDARAAAGVERGASASISRNPSAWEKLVTAPEPLAVGNATGPGRLAPAPPGRTPCGRARRRSAPARAASIVCAASGARPARARITGATKAWKVKIAEVGNPGSTTSGLRRRPRRDRAACPA